jgi:FtsH-binding integral membrane protein
MTINGTLATTNVMIALVCLGVLLLGMLVVGMRMRHRYPPGLIGAVIGALLCFLLLEALPAFV